MPSLEPLVPCSLPYSSRLLKVGNRFSIVTSGWGSRNMRQRLVLSFLLACLMLESWRHWTSQRCKSVDTSNHRAPIVLFSSSGSGTYLSPGYLLPLFQASSSPSFSSSITKSAASSAPSIDTAPKSPAASHGILYSLEQLPQSAAYWVYHQRTGFYRRHRSIRRAYCIPRKKKCGYQREEKKRSRSTRSDASMSSDGALFSMPEQSSSSSAHRSKSSWD